MKMKVYTYFDILGEGGFELPEPYTPEDISSCGIKWDVIYLMMKDGVELKFELSSELQVDSVDTKRPSGVSICDEDSNEVFSV